VLLKADITFGAARRRRWKSQYLLPVRNRLLGERPISLRLNGTTMRLAPVSRMAAFLWTSPRAETQPLEFLMRFLQAGQIFWDIGADAGLFSVALAKRIGAAGVYAFEPDAERFQLLLRHLELNGLTGLHASQMALGDRTTSGPRTPVSGPVATSPEKGKNFPDDWPIEMMTTPVTTADAFIESEAIPVVNAMRIGAAGPAMLILRGAEKLLDRPDAPLILYEVSTRKTGKWGYHPVETFWFLADCGYRFFTMDLQNGRITPHQPRGQYDGLFVAAKSLHMPRLEALGNPH
jgi:FkbM family methyltransferase